MIDTKKIERMLKKSEQLAARYECKLNLGFSGGKDSVVLKYFADYYGINYIAHFNNTQEDEYPKYDNYDAIEVSKTADIPMDYDGVMGVPITFLDKYNPEQFELVGYNRRASSIYGKQTFKRLFIKRIK